MTSFCSVEWRDDLAPAIGKSRMAVALCGQHAFVLGLADEFKITMNEGEGAALVDLFRNGARRVLLVSRQGQERPLLEDISGQISMSAGKGPMSTLEDIEIDFAGFASDGVIVVQGHPTDSKAGQIVRVDLKQQVDGVRAARLAAAK